MAETVAFLFSDIEGSTRLLTRVGAERYRDALTAYRATVEAASAEVGGTVVDREGDGLFLVFPTATAAMRAAWRAQERIAGAEWPGERDLAIRMGIHAGSAQRHAGGYVGLAVHRAARVASAAHGGQVLVSDAAKALAVDDLPDGVSLRDLGEHRLKDLEGRERLYQLEAPGLASSFPPPETLDGTPNNLPLQPTTFIGRERELREVAELLAGERLVTLTGVGGVGKSRLAYQAAAERLGHHDDGVWVVELAAVADPGRVGGQVAGVLGIREDQPSGSGGDFTRDRLVEHLRERDLLLVLDNCEHLLTEVSELADTMLRSCPDVRILATSREALGIAGETIWRIPSLSLPDEAALGDGGGDAVRLFAERARSASRSFELSADTIPLVQQICRRLDGIPLAIELAAARTRVLGVDQLAERLDDRFRLLTGGSRTALPRQQTLEAAIDWSYQLLSDVERALLARLSVFSGGFTLEAAEDVCAGGAVDATEVADLVFHLVDKSLVTVVEGRGGPERYRLLETLRQYARARLVESGDVDAIRDRHRDWYLRLAGRGGPYLRGPQRLAWADELSREHENLRAALDWSIATHTDAAATTLAAALARHASDLGQFAQELVHWRTALAHASGGDPEREADLRVDLAGALSSTGDGDAALEEAERARDLVADRQHSAARVRALAAYARFTRASTRRSAQDAVAPARDALAAARALGDAALLAAAHGTLGTTLAWIGETDAGIDELREALDAARATQDRTLMAAVYQSLYLAVHDFGHRAEEADALEADVRRWLDTMPDDTGWSFELWGLIAYHHLRRGDWREVEAVLERVARFHLEGFSLAWLLQVRGALRWMQGRLDDARSDAEQLSGMRIIRWNHDLYPLLAEIAAAQGRLDEVRGRASEYLSQPVDPSEEAMKVAVLAPLARAEADAAQATTGDERRDHVRRCAQAVARARQILEQYPPATTGAIQFEVPAIYLALAQAELSRLDGQSVLAWRAIVDDAWYAYTRLYARWRLAEALLDAGDQQEGLRELEVAHREATERGATAIARACVALAPHYGIEL